jgi:hypothetical protein
MLDVRVIMNSSVEDVLGFKCCALQDQNLELHIRNAGEHPLAVRHYFDLENGEETRRCDTLYPPWVRELGPGETSAFYCSMDETVWNRFITIVLYDGEGNAYRFPTGVPAETLIQKAV